MQTFPRVLSWARPLILAWGLLAASCSSPLIPLGSSGTAAGRQVSGPTAPGADAAWFTQSNVYQIFPATFSPQGNLAGVTGKMDYLKDLGVKTIWLMPIFPAMNTHGYDTSDYYGIAPHYGTPQDLTNLVEAAHARDIRVVLDLVVNHTGTSISWFSHPSAASRHDNWYIWSDRDLGWDDPWNWNSQTNQFAKTWFPDPFPNYDRNGNGNLHDDDYYYSVFGDSGGSTMPDLNWKGARTEITNEIVNVMQHWIATSGVDGFRCDAARYLSEDGPGQQADLPLTHTLWQDLRSRLTAFAPGAVLIAESPTETYSAMKAYYGSNASPEFHSAFHFKYSGTLMGTLKNSWYDGSFFPDLFAIQSNLPSGAVDTLFLSNHDAFTGDRVATQLQNNTGKVKLAGSLYLTLSGNPATYYGEEYGIQNVPGQSGDNAIRGMMDWNAVTSQKADTNSVLNHYRALYTLRNTFDALRGGITYAANSNGSSGWAGYSGGGNHVAWIREYFGEKILVVHNLSSAAMNVQVDLTSTGLTFANNTPVTAIMGGVPLPAVTTSNQSYYDVGSVGAYATRILYLGSLPARYAGVTYEAARSAAWTGSGSPAWTAAWFRGTPNAWGTTAMTKDSQGLWTTTQTFDAASPRFKISRYQDWTEAYPAADYPVPGAGTYLITFNETTKAITAVSTGGSGGTLTIVLKANAAAQNVKFPGDFNGWNINTANGLAVAANTTGTLPLSGAVTSTSLSQGNNGSALELQVINGASGTWGNNWNFASWTKAGCSVPDGKQITIACSANQNVTLTIDTTTSTLTAVVQ